jgi:hypothetical protein
MRRPGEPGGRGLGGEAGVASTGEWMYLFKPLLAETALYVKVILRNECVVISFHEDEEGDHEEDDA